MSGSLQHEIMARLEALANGRADPGEAADWAREVMAGDDPLLAWAPVWRALDELAGADLMTGPATRLHSAEDFRGWLAEFRSDCPDELP